MEGSEREARPGPGGIPEPGRSCLWPSLVLMVQTADAWGGKRVFPAVVQATLSLNTLSANCVPGVSVREVSPRWTWGTISRPG